MGDQHNSVTDIDPAVVVDVGGVEALVDHRPARFVCGAEEIGEKADGIVDIQVPVSVGVAAQEPNMC